MAVNLGLSLGDWGIYSSSFLIDFVVCCSLRNNDCVQLLRAVVCASETAAKKESDRLYVICVGFIRVNWLVGWSICQLVNSLVGVVGQYLSVCLSACLPVCLFVCLSLFMYLCVFAGARARSEFE